MDETLLSKVRLGVMAELLPSDWVAFTELQRRIPDKWFFQRLLPAAVYVVLAVLCGAQLGQGHWADVGLAHDGGLIDYDEVTVTVTR